MTFFGHFVNSETGQSLSDVIQLGEYFFKALSILVL